MTTIVRSLRLVPVLATFALAMTLPTAASAQSDLDTSEAQAYIGNWDLSFESPQGAFAMGLEVTDMSGKVGATVSADMMGETEISDISISGGNLVMRYEIDAQGQMAPVALTVTSDGSASMDFADGMFVMDGTAEKGM